MNKTLKKLFLFLVCSSIIFCYTYFCSMLFNDEIWNYGFAYNIATGLIPYRDFSMVVTPFYSFLVSIFIVLFGHHLWVIHLLNAIMISIMLLIIYRKVGKKVFVFFPILLLYSYPGYNLFCLFLMIILITICEVDFIYKDVIMGLLCGILILTKQTIGFLVLIPTIYYAKNRIKCLVSFSIPVVIFIVYLIYYGALYFFIDYCFLGMFEFSNCNRVLLFFPLEIVICILLFYRLIKSKLGDRAAFYVLMYQIITFPIFDDYHFMIGFLLVLYYFLAHIEIKEYRLKYYFVILLFTTMFWNYAFNGYIDFHHYQDKNSYLYGRYVYQYVENSITTITDYMESVKNNYDFVYLFTQNSYVIKMNTSYDINKFDLINNGNMGYQGSVRYIQEIDNFCGDHSCLFILYRYEIDRDNLMSNQTNIDIIDYVSTHYRKQREIDSFDIYVNF